MLLIIFAISRWITGRRKKSSSGFRQQNLAEYERLDKEFEGLTETETRLGAFWFSKG